MTNRITNKIACIALIFMMLTLTACGTAEAAQDNSEATVQTETKSQNTILVSLGQEVTIDGVTYHAGIICAGYYGNGLTTDSAGYSFVWNRVNKHVYLRYSNASDRYATPTMIDTGLVYEGPAYLKGNEIPPLNQNQKDTDN